MDNVDVPDPPTRANVKSVNQVTADRSYSESKLLAQFHKMLLCLLLHPMMKTL